MANTSSYTEVECPRCVRAGERVKVYLVLEHFEDNVVMRMYSCENGHSWEEVDES